MALPTLKELQSLSQETGFLQNPLEKVLRIVSILKRLSEHPFLQDKLVLKGGTALNLFYFDLPRLSIDIDLNYVGSLERSVMLTERGQIRAIMEDLFSDDYRVEEVKKEFALAQFELSYGCLADTEDMLKVEINYLHRLPLLETKVEYPKRFDRDIKFPVLALDEIMASKVIALLSRYTPRDLFDVYKFSISTSTVDLRLFRSLILFYGLITRTSVFELLEMNLDLVSDYDVRRFLHPLMVRRARPERNAIIDQVQKFLTPVLTLSESEKKAIDRFYHTGSLDCELLFPNGDLGNKIPMSPAYRWKVQNLKKFLERNESGTK